MNSSQLADKLAKLMVATAIAASAPAILAQTAKPVTPVSNSPASSPPVPASAKGSTSVAPVAKPEAKKEKAESPCAPGNPCAPGKKKKKKTDGPCAPASPCAPKK